MCPPTSSDAPSFLSFIESELARSGIAANRVVLELTELALMSNSGAARDVLTGAPETRPADRA